MSYKTQQDKKRGFSPTHDIETAPMPYPWTARQRRQKEGRRHDRKQSRHAR